MTLLYNILITIAAGLLPILSLFLSKLKERQKYWKESQKSLKDIKHSDKVVWFHAASMGEFEQAKPIIEYIKKKQLDIKIVCTFFSPSGYNTQKNYQFADAICYLPFDTYWNARRFISLVKPDVAIFIRYEIWFNYLKILNKRLIPTLLINATAPTNDNFLIKQFYRNAFNLLTEIYAASSDEYEKLQSLNLTTNILISSDTRIDWIIAKVDEAKNNPVISRKLFADDELIFVAGSVWNEDIDIILDACNKFENTKIRLILVPHEPTTEHIQYIQSKINNTVLLSKVNNILAKDSVIIVDSIGKLLKLYCIADFAYIGGAFGVGVHSITEPAGYGIPLVTGTNCFNSPDTKSLLACEALTIVNNSDMLYAWFLQVLYLERRETMGTAAKEYIHQHSGATNIISDKIIYWLRCI